MTIPSEIFELAAQLTNELDSIDRQAKIGLATASQLLERFPDNARLIDLYANVGKGLAWKDKIPAMRYG